MSPFRYSPLRNFRLARFAVILLVAAALPVLAAPNRFISDQLTVELRLKPGDTMPVTGHIAAGAPVEVVSTSPGGWTQVRTRAGQIGWVRSNQMMDVPPIRPRMDQASREFAELREQNQRLRNQVEALETTALQTGPDLERLRAETQRLRDALKLSQEGLHMAEINQKLREDVASLRLEIQALEQQAERLTDRSRRDTGRRNTTPGCFHRRRSGHDSGDACRSGHSTAIRSQTSPTVGSLVINRAGDP